MSDLTRYYIILGLKNNSSKKDVKTAYRKLSLKYHPDKNKNNTEQKFRDIVYAYKTIINSKNHYQQKYIHKTNNIKNNFKYQKNEYNFQTYRKKTDVKSKESHKTTHFLLYIGLVIITCWIIITESIK